MKKIGILFGKEDTFPQAFIDRVNEKGLKDIKAEAVSIEMVQQAAPTEYAVIIDRISQDVPYYRAYLKNAAISGTAVINNPFWWSADEKFFNNALAERIGVPVPKTVILPSYHRPEDTGENSFRNLKFPYGWDKNFEYVGFPAYMKPHDGGGWKSVYRVENAEDLFAKHAETEQLVMMLQEEVQFTEYFRCYVLGGNNVHIMQYEPRNPHHERYVLDGPPVDKAILDKVREYCIKLNQALGYDFNTVEFAIRDGIPYAIDFCNPAPDADLNSVGPANFEWIVENAANLAIEKAKAYKAGKMNLTWGTFIKDQIQVTKSPAKKAAPAKVKTSSRRTTVAKKAKPAKTVAKASSTKTVAVKKATPTKAKPVSRKATVAKKATVRKSAAKSSSANAKAAPTKKASVAKKTTTNKTVIISSAAKAKTTPVKKAAPKAAAKTTAASTTAASKTAVKKAIPAKAKPVSKKATTSKTVAKSSKAKTSTAKKAAVKASVKASVKPKAKKVSTAKKTTARKPAAKKTVVKSTAAKK